MTTLLEESPVLTPPEMCCPEFDPAPWDQKKYVWSNNLFLKIPGANMVKLSGTFMSRVFDGPYNHVPKYIKEMDSYLAAHRMKVKKYYFHYAYCSKCAKKYGHNFIVTIAEI